MMHVTEKQKPPLPHYAPMDSPGAFVMFQGLKLYVVDEEIKEIQIHIKKNQPNDKPVLVCVHGIPGTHRDFRYLAPAMMARGWRVVRLDMPGFGQSSDPIKEEEDCYTSPLQRAHLIQELILSKGIKQYAIIGHSFGGTTALHTAAKYPDFVQQLVLVNSVGTRRHRGLLIPQKMMGMGSHLLRYPKIGDVLAARLKAVYERHGLKSERPLNRETFAWHAKLIASIDFAEQQLACGMVQGSALVVSSEDDPLVQPSVLQDTYSSLTMTRQKSHIHMPYGGHFCQKWAVDSIAQWLDETWISYD